MKQTDHFCLELQEKFSNVRAHGTTFTLGTMSRFPKPPSDLLHLQIIMEVNNGLVYESATKKIKVDNVKGS